MSDPFAGLEIVEEDAPAGGGAPSPPPAPHAMVIDPHATTGSVAKSARVSKTYAIKIRNIAQRSLWWAFARSGSQTFIEVINMLLSEAIASEVDLVAEFRALLVRDDGTQKFQPKIISASLFGAAVGHSPYTTQDALVADMLWGLTRSNDAMRYGSMKEDDADEIFTFAMFFLSGGEVEMEHHGLILDVPALECGKDESTGEPAYEGWCGVSPDGVLQIKRDGAVVDRQLVEYKCPFYQQRKFYSECKKHWRFGIAQYYYDQVQGISGLLGFRDIYFVVHLPDRTQVLKFVHNEAYSRSLIVALRDFWHNRYLPAAVLCARGALRVGEIDVVDRAELGEIDAQVHRTLEEDLLALQRSVRSIEEE